MAVNIKIDLVGSPGTPGVARSEDFSWIASTSPTVSLSLDAVYSSYYWTILDQPEGATAVLSSPTAANPTFDATADIPGTYLIQCQVDGSGQIGRNAIGFKTQHKEHRKPAAGETTEYGATGWKPAVNEVIDDDDADPWLISSNIMQPRYSGSFMRLDSSGVSVDIILDEDNMVSDSATALCTQQSIKKYIDDSIAVENLWDRSSGTLSPHFSGDNVKITIADEVNKIPLEIEQNDITNKPAGIKITAPGFFSSGIDTAGQAINMVNSSGAGFPNIITGAAGQLIIIQTHTTTSQDVGTNIGSFSNGAGDCNFQGLALGVTSSFSGEANAVLSAEAPTGSSGNAQVDLKVYSKGTGTASSDDWVIGTAGATGPIDKEIRVHQQAASNTNDATLALTVIHAGTISGDSFLLLSASAVAGSSIISLSADDITIQGDFQTPDTGPIWGMSANSAGAATLTISATNAGAGFGYLKLTSDIHVWSDKTYRVSNNAPTYELRDTDSTVDNGGLWHLALNGGNVSIRENTAVAGDFSTSIDWLKIWRSTDKITTEANQFQFQDGTVSAPGISFVNDPNNGIYRIGTDNWGLSANGALALEIGDAVTGKINFNGATRTASTVTHDAYVELEVAGVAYKFMLGS